MEGQLTRPHDQSRGWDWLETASALTASKHPDEEEKVNRHSKRTQRLIPKPEEHKLCKTVT